MEFEIYVIDAVKASIWAKTLLKEGDVVSRGTDDCDIVNCQKCGDTHGIARSDVLAKNGLAARKV